MHRTKFINPIFHFKIVFSHIASTIVQVVICIKLVHFWFIFGSFLACFLNVFGSFLVRFWLVFGYFLVRFFSIFFQGPNFAKMWEKQIFSKLFIRNIKPNFSQYKKTNQKQIYIAYPIRCNDTKFKRSKEASKLLFFISN